MKEEGYVLYVDHAQHPAPLSNTFHATGARRLSSDVFRYPPATLTEVDSAYCPQCLSYHDSASAARLGYCPKPSCARCPLCQNVCSVGVEGSVVFYQCGNSSNNSSSSGSSSSVSAIKPCEWTSKDCQIVADISDNNNEPQQKLGRLEFARAMEDLGNVWKRKKAAADVWQDPWTTLARAWTKRIQEQGRSSTVGGGSRRDVRAPSLWSVETLEASLKERHQAWVDSDLGTHLNLPVQHISLDNENVIKPALDNSLEGVSHTALQLQALNQPHGIVSRADLLPLPVPLRPRNSRRCRAELAQGRPGILLKPKLNPLEGDSSLRSGHGQWFKKDSSAILVVPRVRVMNVDVSTERSIFLIKVTNPTLGPIRLRFAASNYEGESSWDSTKPNVSLKQVLVDELKQTFLDVDLNTNTLRDLATTETVELLSSEDSFIEFGGKARELPEEIREWKAPITTTVEKSSMRLAVASTSTAWFELVTSGFPSSDSGRPGICAALEVEVGNGSWESSLIPQQKDKQDFVVFDLVITWS